MIILSVEYFRLYTIDIMHMPLISYKKRDVCTLLKTGNWMGVWGFRDVYFIGLINGT